MSGRSGQVRHQLYMSPELSDRLAALARKPGVTMSSIMTQALGAWLDRKGVSELQERFGTRLDNLTRAIARIERNSQIEIEILALLVRYLLASIRPSPRATMSGARRAVSASNGFRARDRVSGRRRHFELRHSGWCGSRLSF